MKETDNKLNEKIIRYNNAAQETAELSSVWGSEDPLMSRRADSRCTWAHLKEGKSQSEDKARGGKVGWGTFRTVARTSAERRQDPAYALTVGSGFKHCLQSPSACSPPSLTPLHPK